MPEKTETRTWRVYKHPDEPPMRVVADSWELRDGGLLRFFQSNGETLEMVAAFQPAAVFGFLRDDQPSFPEERSRD